MFLNFRIVGAAIVGLCMAVSSLDAQDDPYQDPSASKKAPASLQVMPTPNSDSSVQALEITAKLDQYIECEFMKTRFDELQKIFQKDLGIAVYIHPNASLNGSDSITFRCNGSVKLGKVLELILEKYEADFAIDGNVIKVISHGDAHDPEFLSRKIFDSRPLIELATHSRMEDYADDREPPKRWEIKMIVEEELVDLIVNTISHDSWVDSSGNGSIVPMNGLLVVCNSRKVLQQVEILLNDMQAKLGDTPE